MTITLTPTGADSCQLLEKTNSSSALFPLPISAPGLITLLRSLLADPEARDAQDGLIYADRMRDGLRVHVGSGNFTIRYADLFPIVMG